MSEEVLVVPRTELFKGQLPPRPFLPGDASGFLAVVGERGFFTPRAAAEANPALKQIIPYGMVLCGDEIFVMRRSRQGGEERLHEKVSLGVGGHVNLEDCRAEGLAHTPPAGSHPRERHDLRAAVAAAFERELAEELVLGARHDQAVVGALNDDSNPVGAVHFGIVYRVELDEPVARVREVESLAGSFVNVKGLGGYKTNMETWSSILLEHFWPG